MAAMETPKIDNVSRETVMRLIHEYAKPEPVAPALIAAMRMSAMILSARLLVVIALIGAFIISLIAIHDPSILKLSCVLLYCAGIFVPLVVLCYRKGFPDHGA
jgi:hypothetical protein